ncbi:hypothetical protein [Halobacteriovorax sp. CON-3]|uniref:hypothetical protein n=1 Tax=Halobacteriovorax sp. CON-3 TaxID=3157710 RepID=UPI00371DDEFA
MTKGRKAIKRYYKKHCLDRIRKRTTIRIVDEAHKLLTFPSSETVLSGFRRAYVVTSQLQEEMETLEKSPEAEQKKMNTYCTFS